MPDVFLLPPFFDYAATFLWAISGALVGARRGFDIVGISMLALVSATGGGLLRDGVFLQDGPPLLVRSPLYLELVVAATLLIVMWGKRVQRIRGFEQLIALVDGLGLGAYAVVGMNRAMSLELSVPGVVLVGMVNAVGGGVLRSVLVARVPHLFRPGTYQAVAAIIGCGIFLSLVKSGWTGQTMAAWITIVAVFAIRVLSVVYGFKTRALRDFEDDWKHGNAADS